MASVTFDEATRLYPGGTRPAVDKLNLEVGDGEFLVLVGPSGCGKSTSLRMLAGLEEVNAGRILIGERDVTDVPPKDRDIAMVFQNYALYPHMTVATNMGFSLEHRGGSEAEIAERVQWAAGVLGLTHLLDRYPRQLSGGQRQRVAMGRAIVRNPQVFLFDEPLSNLDAKLRVVMRGEIKGLHQRLGVTTIYVTHDQVEAMTMADRIVVMNGGRVEQVGAPLDLYDRPANLFVAGFIGSPSMNFIEGTVANQGLVGRNVTLPLTNSPQMGTKAVYGIRPENLSLADDGLPARITLIEPMGPETQVTMTLGDHTITGVFRERIAARPGDIIHVRPDLDTIHLFDAATGLRIE